MDRITDFILDRFSENGKTYGADIFGRVYEIRINEPKEQIQGIVFRGDHFIVPKPNGWIMTKTICDAIAARDGKYEEV